MRSTNKDYSNDERIAVWRAEADENHCLAHFESDIEFLCLLLNSSLMNKNDWAAISLIQLDESFTNRTAIDRGKKQSR